MKLDKLNLDGKKDSIEVLDKIFSAKVNPRLVSNVLYKTNANYKGRHAKTKQQNEVSGPTAKIFSFKVNLLTSLTALFTSTSQFFDPGIEPFK